ncbi:MAG: DUF1698 domain-containing protein [Planctomycetia bacterium]|nr:DUF1698 domain-containing protein [Planctomycetia bacterium]
MTTIPADYFDGVRWHQRWEVAPGVFTPGCNPVPRVCGNVGLPADLTGKRVLDVGAWNGCFSFECERRGAAEVVAVSLEDPEETGFERLHRLLNSRVRYVRGSAYALSPDELGTFDVILFFGVLYHLRYPLLAIDRLRGVCRGEVGEVFIETHVCERDYRLRGPLAWLGRTRLFSRLLGATPLWRQYRAYELHPQDASNWFGPNSAAVREAFASAGFDCEFVHLLEDRASFRAKVQPEPPERVLSQTYEAYPDNRRLVGLEHLGATAEPRCHR